jgi:hypothetical protein
VAGTVQDLLTLALKQSGILGVGQIAAPEDLNDAFTMANEILALWNAQRWMIYHLTDNALTCTGAQSYLVGPGGDFNIARPDKLESACLRQPATSGNSGPIDYQLRILPSYEDYARITLKTLTTNISNSIFYDSGYPLGTVYPWPLPSSQYELHLILKDQLTAFTSLQQTINLPPVYSPGLRFTLCTWLRPSYGLEADLQVAALARGSMAVIKSQNTQVPLLKIPRALLNRNGQSYSIFSDGPSNN